MYKRVAEKKGKGSFVTNTFTTKTFTDIARNDFTDIARNDDRDLHNDSSAEHEIVDLASSASSSYHGNTTLLAEAVNAHSDEACARPGHVPTLLAQPIAIVEHHAVAEKIQHIQSKFEYLFGIVLGKCVLRHTDNLSKALQSPKIIKDYLVTVSPAARFFMSEFSTTLSMEYRFEEVQNLQFVVYDVDDKHHVDNIDKQELLGAMECTLAEIMAAGVHLTKPLGLKGNPAGTITIQAEEVRNSEFLMYFELSATKLEKKDLFGKSDPYIEIAKAQEGGEFTVVYRSKPIMKTLSPRWPAFHMEMQTLCSGDWERTLQFSVWDWNRSGNNELIGLATTSLKDICPERGGNVFDLELTNPYPKSKKKCTGVLVFYCVKTVPRPTFVDYIKGGCQISLIVAVDFTVSDKLTLHMAL
eukprot:Em0020g582a